MNSPNRIVDLRMDVDHPGRAAICFDGHGSMTLQHNLMSAFEADMIAELHPCDRDGRALVLETAGDGERIWVNMITSDRHTSRLQLAADFRTVSNVTDPKQRIALVVKSSQEQGPGEESPEVLALRWIGPRA